MKKSFLLIIAVIASCTIYAQSPVGTWKGSNSYSITHNGKKEDFKVDAAEKACMAKTTYQFTADGKIITKSDGGCTIDKDKDNIFVSWKSAGKGKITITWDDKDLDPETFDLEIIGNKMRWIKNFPDDPEIPNDKDFKQVVIEYVKA